MIPMKRQMIENLYQESGPKLLSFLLSRHGPNSAEDLLQETFQAAARQVDRLAEATSPQAYLFAIARNLSIDLYRKERRFEELPEDLVDESTAQPDPRLEEMRLAIRKLSVEHREVVHLRMQHDLTYEEIAEALCLPVGTVRSRLHHALLHLRKLTTKSDSQP